MLLSVFERLILLNILPAEGDYTTLKLVRKLRDDLSFDEAEHAALQFKESEGRISWRTTSDEGNPVLAAQDKEIEIGAKAKAIIVGIFEKLDKEKKLKAEHLTIYEKFVEVKE